MEIKLVLTDIDGVWTDGGMYYDNLGNELKKFNTSDSAGVLFLKHLKIPIGVITGEQTEIVNKRFKKLKIQHVFQGVKNKTKIASQLCKQLNIDLQNVAYIGDDINDIQLLQSVGLSACPANSPYYVKNKVDWVLQKNGGDGVFREFIEKILTQEGILDRVVNEIIEETIQLNQ